MHLVYFVEALFRGEKWAKRRAVEGLVFLLVIGLSAGVVVLIQGG